MSRGLDNCNPGNIRISGVRYKGEVRPGRDREFRCFESLAWGYRAIFVLLHTYARRYGCRTLRQMIARYAPPSENPTGNYLKFVAREAGVDADTPLDTLDSRTMTAVVSAISRFENGTPADAISVAEGWHLFRLDFS